MLAGAASLTGVDLDPGVVAFAARSYPGIRFLEGRMGTLPFSGPPQFDVVLCLEGLEHVGRGEAEDFLAEAHRVLRPGGGLIVTAPLLADGKHSGNPYHLYEFTAAELRELLTHRFDEVQFERMAGPEGHEVRFVGGRREAPREDSTGLPPQEHGAVVARLHRWAMSQATATGFRFAAGGEETLVSTSCGVLLLDGLGRLGEVSGEQREAWTRTLQSSSQDDVDRPLP